MENDDSEKFLIPTYLLVEVFGFHFNFVEAILEKNSVVLFNLLHCKKNNDFTKNCFKEIQSCTH